MDKEEIERRVRRRKIQANQDFARGGVIIPATMPIFGYVINGDLPWDSVVAKDVDNADGGMGQAWIYPQDETVQRLALVDLGDLLWSDPVIAWEVYRDDVDSLALDDSTGEPVSGHAPRPVFIFGLDDGSERALSHDRAAGREKAIRAAWRRMVEEFKEQGALLHKASELS